MIILIIWLILAAWWVYNTIDRRLDVHISSIRGASINLSVAGLLVLVIINFFRYSVLEAILFGIGMFLIPFVLGSAIYGLKFGKRLKTVPKK